MASSYDIEEMRKAERAQGPATILAIGTAVPHNCIQQSDYPDYYFRVTKSEHMVALKDKFRCICEKTTIRKRYFHMTEEYMNDNPGVGEYMARSLDARMDPVVEEVPRLGKEAAMKAIKEWGQPISDITHVVFCTISGIGMPGADYALTKLLGLNPSVKRHMVYQQGCFAGGTVLRLAKDLAENNKGARVLVVCSESTTATFSGPNEANLGSLIQQTLFGDGAAAVIVGSDPELATERPLFQVVSADQTIAPDSEDIMKGRLTEAGLTLQLHKSVPEVISKNVENSLTKLMSPLGITDWNSIFWIAHPGGPAILDRIEQHLGLREEKLKATRDTLSDYGNLSSASVLFILDAMRKKSVEEGATTTGEGLEWGVLFGFGPGLTVETVVLHSLPTSATLV